MTDAPAPKPSTPSGGGPGHQDSRRDTKETVRLVVAGIGLLLLIAFAVANSASVHVSFLVTSARVGLIWVIIISALLGVVVDRLVIMLRRRRRRR